MLPSERYVTAMLVAAEATHGRPLNPGTTVVAHPERAGTGSATCYPLPGTSIVWSDPHVVERLSDLETSRPLSAETFVQAAVECGAQLVGYGRNRTLDGPLLRPAADLGNLTVRHIDGADPALVAMLDELAGACDPDDVDEADLDLDHLDPTYTLLVTPAGEIAAYASARPHDHEPSFDDIAVLTHPAWRGRRLGALAVHEFIRRRATQGHHPLYRCNVDNVASNHVAESLGFSVVTTIGGVTFAGLAP